MLRKRWIRHAHDTVYWAQKVRNACQSDCSPTTMSGMAGKSSPAPRGKHVLDDVSKSIIEQLQQDGRRSYASIGKAVGLSEAAVRQRVQRLSDAGVMQIVAVTDPLQLGFGRQAMVG